MKKFADFITKKHILVLFIGLLFLVPSIIGYINTRINYDILVYLPEEIDTIKGERILTKDFGIGSYAFVMIDTKDNYKVLKLEEKVKTLEQELENSKEAYKTLTILSGKQRTRLEKLEEEVNKD